MHIDYPIFAFVFLEIMFYFLLFNKSHIKTYIQKLINSELYITLHLNAKTIIVCINQSIPKIICYCQYFNKLSV